MSINFDNEIEEILNEDIVLSESILRKKEMAYNTIRKNKKTKFPLKNIIVASAAILIIAVGVTFGGYAIAQIKNSLFPNNSGVQKAVDNGYIQEIDNSVMKDNGVEIKVNSVLKDSKRLAFSLNLKFDHKDLMKYFQHMKIKLAIKNDSGKEMRFGRSNYDSTVNNETGELTFNDISTSVSDTDNDAFGEDFDPNDFKNLNSFNLEIKEIQLYTEPSSEIDPSTLPNLDDDTKKQLAEAGTKLYKIIAGTWTTNIKLDEKFTNTLPIEYKVSEDNSEINISSAKLLPTGMDIIFNFKHQKGNLSRETMLQTSEITLIDDNGITYKASEFGSSSGTEINRTDIGKNFFITSFDKVGDLKLIIKDLNGNIQKIKLVKAN